MDKEYFSSGSSLNTISSNWLVNVLQWFMSLPNPHPKKIEFDVRSNSQDYKNPFWFLSQALKIHTFLSIACCARITQDECECLVVNLRIFFNNLLTTNAYLKRHLDLTKIVQVDSQPFLKQLFQTAKVYNVHMIHYLSQTWLNGKTLQLFLVEGAGGEVSVHFSSYKLRFLKLGRYNKS